MLHKIFTYFPKDKIITIHTDHSVYRRLHPINVCIFCTFSSVFIQHGCPFTFIVWTKNADIFLKTSFHVEHKVNQDWNDMKI